MTRKGSMIRFLSLVHSTVKLWSQHIHSLFLPLEKYTGILPPRIFQKVKRKAVKNDSELNFRVSLARTGPTFQTEEVIGHLGEIGGGAGLKVDVQVESLYDE